MAVWGTPVAREDDAERAVRAALELLDAVTGLGHGIAARAGVMTGEAAVTLGATDQGMVAGDLVNTAARVQSVAAPGTVLVGEATHRAASAAIAFEEAGAHALKGKEEPVRTWRALRVVAERGGRGRQELLEPPFVGRAEELRLLKELFHGTVREGRARLVSITGPAGIGKSRLAWEFEKYLDGVVEPVWWHHGRSPSYGGGVAFWALGEMVRTRAGLAEGADEATTRTAVSTMLDRHVADPGERAWVEPAILQLLGVETGAVASGELFARWRVLFERLTATGTVVLVFEDLHWADTGTLDFIDHLLDWSKSVPLLIVTLARPDLLDLRPEWGAGRRSFVAVPLEPLAEPAMRALLRGLVPGLPDDALRRIIERAEGIPLYAVETIRMLVAERRLVVQDDVLVPAGDMSTFAIPETLTALIAARLDGLEARDRALILDAAVLGQRFTLDALAAVSGIAPAELESRLRSLVRRELLDVEADPRSPERGQFGFVQALIREVAYNTLARRDRKERHLAAARYFESIGSDELAGALAAHYLAAHANAPEGPEADALATQARIALRGAAERAIALASPEQAITLLREGLTVASAPLDRADLLERLGLAAETAGRYAEASEALEEAAAILRHAGTEEAVLRVLLEAGTVKVNAKQLDEARLLLEGAADDFVHLGTHPGLLAIRGALARALGLTDHYREALAVAETVLEPAEHAREFAVIADVLVTKGTMLVNVGRQVEGVALLAAARRLAEEHGLTATLLRAINNLAVMTVESDPAGSVRVAAEGVELARRLGNAAWVNNFVGNIIFLEVRLGDWDLVEREAVERLDSQPEIGDLILLLSNLGAPRALRGQPVDDLVERLAALQAELPEDQWRPAVLDLLGMDALARGDDARAASLWLEAAESSPSYGAQTYPTAARAALWAGDLEVATRALDRYEAMHLHQPATAVQVRALRAGVRVRQGSAADEEPTFVAAWDVLSGFGLRLDAAFCALDAAYVLGPERPAVARMLEEARAFCLEVGATPLLRRLEALTGAAEGRAEAP
ncbi:MAG TPA: AAA family ATPase, partial [Candidatus Limnocylindrales bacterium]|nr:AAA family ATPase [Candidatus Limnocylindrales bacterium]